MKTISFVLVMSMALAAGGCGKKAGGSTGSCADAVGKGVDQMIATRKEKVAAAPAEMKARAEERAKKMDEVAGKLKETITNRCVEDKWSADVIDCYSHAKAMDDLKVCRSKLPADQAAKLQGEEMQVMMSAMGGMRGGMGGPPGMGGPGMGNAPPGGMGGPGMGSAQVTATPPAGSDGPAPSGSAAPAPAAH